MERVQWEYLTAWRNVQEKWQIIDGATPRVDRQQRLNQLGADGWELVSVDGGIGYFKRPKTARQRHYEDPEPPF